MRFPLEAAGPAFVVGRFYPSIHVDCHKKIGGLLLVKPFAQQPKDGRSRRSTRVLARRFVTASTAAFAGPDRAFDRRDSKATRRHLRPRRPLQAKNVLPQF